MPDSKPKRFNGIIRRCAVCRGEIVFARTVATERGPGGKYMPINVEPDPEGRIAIRDLGGRVLRARPLAADETHDTTAEVLGKPHQATCPGSRTNIAADAEAYLRSLEGGGDQ